MKTLLAIIFTWVTISGYAFQDTTSTMPPEETQPTSYWWWIIGVVITLAIGIIIYRMIKKDPRKDG